MREIIRKKVKVIQSTNAQDFENRLNEILDEVNEPQIDFFKECGLCAVITYQERELKAENLADEYNLKGIYYTCADCPHLELNTDKRFKYHNCEYKGLVRLEQTACNRCYRELHGDE